MPLIEYKELSSAQKGESSADVRARVVRAREVQKQRYAEHGTLWNAHLPSRLMRQYCAIDKETNAYLEQVMNDLNFSARAYDRILKLARTIADLAAKEQIELADLMEAIQFRTLDRKLS